MKNKGFWWYTSNISCQYVCIYAKTFIYTDIGTFTFHHCFFCQTEKVKTQAFYRHDFRKNALFEVYEHLLHSQSISTVQYFC